MILNLRSGVRINTDQLVRYYPTKNSTDFLIEFRHAVAYTSSMSSRIEIETSKILFATEAERDKYLAEIDALVGAIAVKVE